MNDKRLENIINEISNRGTVKSEDIPKLDLYMDQIMTLFDNYLSDHKRYEDDKLLTKTMINNYSKEGILKPIKGKKYTKEHILQMLLIYSLKNTISIQEIKKILAYFHEENKDIEPIYQQSLDLTNEIIKMRSQELIHFIEEKELDSNNYEDLTVIISIICSLSNFYQSIAQKILDTYYVDEETKKEAVTK